MHHLMTSKSAQG